MSARRGRFDLAGASLALLTGLVGFPEGARAQARPETAVNDIEELVVTARRREENLLNVPVAITALGGETLVKQNVTSPQDLQRLVPGLASGPGNTRGNAQMVVAIRGQRNGDPAIAADPSVGVYFAEVPQNGPQGLNTSFVDLASVQVLKGPQGPLFGRNATGGAILIEPNAPTQELGGYGKVTLGDYELQDYEAVLNLPLAEAFALRAVGKYTRRAGYFQNVLTGQKTNDIDRYSLRLSARFAPNDALESTTIGIRTWSDNGGEGVRLDKLSRLATPALVAAFGRIDALPKYKYINNLAPGFPIPALFSYDRTWSLQNTTSYELSDTLQIKNVAGWRKIHSGGAVDADATEIQVSVSDFRAELRELSEEFQVLGDLGDLDFVAGLYYFQMKGNETIVSLGNPITRRVSDADVTNTSYSAYAHIDYDLASVMPNLSLSLGGRITKDKREWLSHTRNQVAVGGASYACPLAGITIPSDDRTLCNTPFEVSFTRPTWEASLNYKPSDDQLLYASYRRGYRTGGFSTGVQNILIAIPYEPETVDAFEVGSKSEFRVGDRPVQLNLAAYYSKYREIQRQTTVFTPGAGNAFFQRVVNAASAHIYGGEAEMVAKPTDRLQISLGYALTVPEYETWIDNVVAGGVAFPVDISDSKFVNISKHQFTATAELDLGVPDRYGVASFLVNYSYRSRTAQFNEINTANCNTGAPPPANLYNNCLNNAGFNPGYGLWNVRLDWRDVMGQGFGLGIFVNNVTDKYYAYYGINALSGFGTYAVGLGPPRLFGVELRKAFGGEQR